MTEQRGEEEHGGGRRGRPDLPEPELRRQHGQGMRAQRPEDQHRHEQPGWRDLDGDASHDADAPALCFIDSLVH
jgi:hypothetical protein